MKTVKKMVTIVLSLAMVLGILAFPATEVHAAAKATVTKSVHLYLGEVRDHAIGIRFSEKGDYVKNLKTNSKNLSAKVVNINSNSMQTDYSAGIGLYATKKGTYTVSFDIMDSDDKKVSSHSVKVYANTDRAVKSAKFAGGAMHRFTDKAKGKLSVTMNKGYTLKKIVVETYDKDGNQESKTVKNNSTVALSKYSFFYESGEVDGDYYSMGTSIAAMTTIRVYFTDKYTKSEANETFYMYRVAQ